MARSYDIAEIMTSDGGLNEQVRRKINMNFRRVVEIATREKSASDEAILGGKIQDVVESYVGSILPDLIREIEEGSFDRTYPVGCVIVTHTSSDPRLSRGKWQAITSGRYVLTAGSGHPVGSTGGSNVIGPGNIPDHVHGLPVNMGYPDPGTGNRAVRPENDILADDSYETGGVIGYPSEQEPFMPEYVALLFYRRIS